MLSPGKEKRQKAMTTFEVNDVRAARNRLPAVKNMAEFVKTKIGAVPESYSKFPGNLIPVKSWTAQNAFVEAVHEAFDNHYPLVLSPDVIWQCVAQGFAIHVNKNAEKLRHMFVAHQEESTKIVLQVDSFVKDNFHNDWEHVLDAFSEEVQKNLSQDIHELLTPDFTTTGPIERVASQIVLMNTFKKYFEYELYTACGIPSITLEGTVEDWKKLREKTLSLSRYDFQWWTDAVKPILDEFVNASSGEVNQEFWQTIYKRFDESGGPYISGWVVKLFPYLGNQFKRMRTNPIVISSEQGRDCLVTTEDFPAGIVSAPFTWLHLKEEFDMYFYAGFLGVGQDKETLALKPVIGWAVVDKEEEKSKMDTA